MAQVNSYKNMTGSGQVIAGVGVISGFYVNSTSAGTIKLWDALSATGLVICNTITPAIGFHNLNNIQATIGVYATIGGTLDVTFMIKQSD